MAAENDTFYSIARYFGVTVDQIIHSNMGVEPENIYEGMILCIPLAAPPVCVTLEGGIMTLDFTNGETERFYYRIYQEYDSDCVFIASGILLKIPIKIGGEKQ